MTGLYAQPGRVARAFDLAGVTNIVCAPFLHVSCEEPVQRGAEGAGIGNIGAKWVRLRDHNTIK